jgi:hypothetical protein
VLCALPYWFIGETTYGIIGETDVIRMVTQQYNLLWEKVCFDFMIRLTNGTSKQNHFGIRAYMDDSMRLNKQRMQYKNDVKFKPLTAASSTQYSIQSWRGTFMCKHPFPVVGCSRQIHRLIKVKYYRPKHALPHRRDKTPSIGYTGASLCKRQICRAATTMAIWLRTTGYWYRGKCLPSYR